MSDQDKRLRELAMTCLAYDNETNRIRSAYYAEKHADFRSRLTADYMIGLWERLDAAERRVAAAHELICNANDMVNERDLVRVQRMAREFLEKYSG